MQYFLFNHFSFEVCWYYLTWWNKYWIRITGCSNLKIEIDLLRKQMHDSHYNFVQFKSFRLIIFQFICWWIRSLSDMFYFALSFSKFFRVNCAIVEKRTFILLWWQSFCVFFSFLIIMRLKNMLRMRPGIHFNHFNSRLSHKTNEDIYI